MSLCSICALEREARKFIEESYWNNEPIGYIISEVKKRWNVRVSGKKIITHMSRHTLKPEVRERYLEELNAKTDKEKAEQIVKQEIDELFHLDEIVKEGYAMRKYAFEKINNKDYHNSRDLEVLTGLWSSASREVIRALKLRMEKLGLEKSDDIKEIIKELWNSDESVEK